LLLFLARVAASDFGALIGLSLFVEVTFGIPGLGRLMLVSYHAQALVLMQSVVLYAAFLGIGASFLVDAIVAALDSDLRDEWRLVARPRTFCCATEEGHLGFPHPCPSPATQTSGFDSGGSRRARIGTGCDEPSRSAR
jgi:hypothetical protein